MPDAPFWQKCNSHCVMCTNSDAYILEQDERYSLAKHREKIAAFRAHPGDRGVYYRNGEHPDYFLFTGGEPTLNPDFFKLLAEYRASFPELPMTLLTNGRRFYQDAFARHTLRLAGRPFDVAVPVHGPDARTHDSVTRAPGSFEETVAGLRHLFRRKGPGQGVEVRIILHRRPAAWLPRTLDFLLGAFPGEDYRLNLVYYEVEGQAERNFKHLHIPLSDCAARVDACFERLERFAEVRLYHFPLCVLARRLWPRAWRSLPRYEIKHVPACGSCAVNDLCLGPHDWYPRLAGAGEFRPLARRPALKLTGSFFRPVAAVGEGDAPWTPVPVEDPVKDEGARW